ncbi:MAG: hypothetical protein H6557_31520 [Lewinellaceae bacterium]|nr:hypothetical protein [Phaeodactylibacter sp.]MCB9041176.1 hypothetical protein [Lewinellaceae bacterium]
MRSTYIIFFCLVVGRVGAQNLPPLADLYASIDSFYAEEAHANLLEFQEDRKGEWLKYVPNVGLTYTLAGAPRPSVSFNTGVLYQAKRDRQRNAARRRSIEEKGVLQAARARGAVAKLYATYLLQLEALEFRRELLAIDEQLFRMEEDRYERGEISPGNFLKAKRGWLLKQQEVRDLEMEMEVLRQEVLVRCFRVGR